MHRKIDRRNWLLSVILAGWLIVAGVSPLPAAAQRLIDFSGYTWLVKAGAAPVGPGPIFFSDSPSNVWLGAQGQLHLKITHDRGTWYCAEVISTQTFGLGFYDWRLASRVDNLAPDTVLALFSAPDTVLALFSYSSDTNEVDIEFSPSGSASSGFNAQYVVQPSALHPAIQLDRWSITAADVPSEHQFYWQPYSAARPGNVQFTSYGFAEHVLQDAALPQPVPPDPVNQHVHMNLWLYQERKGGPGEEVVISSFSFDPYELSCVRCCTAGGCGPCGMGPRRRRRPEPSTGAVLLPLRLVSQLRGSLHSEEFWKGCRIQPMQEASAAGQLSRGAVALRWELGWSLPPEACSPGRRPLLHRREL